MSEKIAESVIAQLGTQIDLIWTLSTALCAGMVACLLQIVFHNLDKSKTPFMINTLAVRLFITSFVVEGAAVLFGYFARGALTNLTPQIYHVTYSKAETWGEATFAGSHALSTFVFMQFAAFILGIVLVILAVWLSNPTLFRRPTKQ